MCLRGEFCIDWGRHSQKKRGEEIGCLQLNGQEYSATQIKISFYVLRLIHTSFTFQQIAFKNLVERNRSEERIQGAPSPNSAIQLPFIIVNTNKKTVIECSISNDK